MLHMHEAATAAECGREGGAGPEVRPARRVEVEFAVAIAQRQVIACVTLILDVRGRGERAPVHVGIDGRNHDPGVDAVGAHEDGDAFGRLPPTRIGRDQAADQSCEKVEQWQRHDGA